MEWIVLALIVSAVSYFANQDERRQAKQDALDLQHDQQQFESDETDEARQWQEDFYLNYQSPEALMDQYRGLGASESASLMSALGVSPSTVQSPQARSGIGTGLGAGVNTMSDLLNSLSGGFNQFMQGQKAKNESEWVGPVNEANIKATLSQLELNWAKFGLDKDIYSNISVPLANMALDKSRQEIDESKARIKEIDSKILQIEQQIRESKQNVAESRVRTDLYGEQINTEVAKQENLGADTALKTAQTGLVQSQETGQDIENALNALSLEASQACGFDVRLSADRQILHGIRVNAQNIITSWQEFSQGVNKTYDGLLKGIDYQSLSRRALHSVHKYMSNPFFPVYDVTKYGPSDFKVNESYKKWMQKRAKKWQDAEEWINHNTRYGM